MQQTMQIVVNVIYARILANLRMFNGCSYSSHNVNTFTKSATENIWCVLLQPTWICTSLGLHMFLVVQSVDGQWAAHSVRVCVCVPWRTVVAFTVAAVLHFDDVILLDVPLNLTQRRPVSAGAEVFTDPVYYAEVMRLALTIVLAAHTWQCQR